MYLLYETQQWVVASRSRGFSKNLFQFSKLLIRYDKREKSMKRHQVIMAEGVWLHEEAGAEI